MMGTLGGSGVGRARVRLVGAIMVVLLEGVVSVTRGSPVGSGAEGQGWPGSIHAGWTHADLG